LEKAGYINQEEHNIVSLSNNDLYCIFRTSEGYPAECYSRDGGHKWSVPVLARDRDGRVIKNPRACPRLFKCSNGNYLLWYHNNNIKGYKGYRNPAWILGGVEKNGRIEWSQPEVLLYGEVKEMMSYPDLIEENGNYWVTETQKEIARVHTIDSEFLEKLWRQGIDEKTTVEGIILEEEEIITKQSFSLATLPGLMSNSFSIELLLKVKELIPGQIILTNTDLNGNGLTMSVTPRRTIELLLKDGEVTSSWDTDPGSIKSGRQHLIFVVDGSANLITTVVNGKLCDGGRYRFTGWNWFDSNINDVTGTGYLTVLSDFNGKIENIRIYNRYLTTSEAVSNYQATLK